MNDVEISSTISRIIHYRIPLLCSFFQWLLCILLRVDRQFFEYESVNRYYIVVKIVYLLLLITLWCFAFEVFRNFKAGNRIYKRGVEVFSYYFIIILVILIMVWPGTWAWDDIWVLDSLKHFDTFYPWQNVLTGIYQDVLLQMIPFPGGIIFLQNVIISICVAFAVTMLEDTFSLNTGLIKPADTIIKLVPFLLFPVLRYQLSGYRMGIYFYLEMTMLVIVICEARNRQRISWGRLILICILTVLCSTWRTESFFYMPCVCAMILVTDKAKIPVKMKCISLIIIILGFLGIYSCQNKELNNNNYKLMSLCRPAVELVRSCNDSENVELINQVGKVIDLDVISANPDLNGEQLFWDMNLVKDNYTEKDYNNFVKAFTKLLLSHPDIFLKERWDVFTKGMGLTGVTITNISEAARLFDNNNSIITAKIFSDNKWLCNRPINCQLRRSIIYLLGIRNSNGVIIELLHYLIWNGLFPITFLLYKWCKALIAGIKERNKKELFVFFVISMVIIRIPIIFLTQPSPWFMYLLSFYMLGYLYLIYQLIYTFGNRKAI